MADTNIAPPGQSMMERIKNLPPLQPKSMVSEAPPPPPPPGDDTAVVDTTAPAPRPAPGPAPQMAAAPYSEDMSWGDYAKGTLQNVPSSGAKFAEGMYTAVTNPEETLDFMGNLAKGVVSKGKGALGFERNPEAEGFVDAVVEDTKTRWSDPAKSFYEDPVSMGLDVASIAPVVGPVGRMAGLGKTAGALQKVAALGDPVNLAAKATSLAAKGVTKPVVGMGRYAQGVASGVPQDMLKLAQQAGRTGTPVQRQAFKEFASGRGDNRALAQAALDAIDERRAAVSAEYVAGKNALITKALPLDSIKKAVNDARLAVDPHGSLLNKPKLDVIDLLEQEIAKVESNPNAAARSAVGLDTLKRSLRDILSANRMSSDGALSQVPTSVRNTIATADAGYAAMMDRWQDWLSEMKDIQTTLGASDRTSETARIAKLLSTAKSSDKMALLKELAEKTEAGQALPYMVAGASVSKFLPPYLQGAGLMGAGMIASGGLHGAAAAALGSPRIAGMSNYALGRAGAAGDRAARVAGMYPSAATNLSAQFGNQQLEEQRVGRKAGGRVGGHEAAADQLVRAAERAKKDLGRSTEPLLSQSDDTVAHALEVANRSI